MTSLYQLPPASSNGLSHKRSKNDTTCAGLRERLHTTSILLPLHLKDVLNQIEADFRKMLGELISKTDHDTCIMAYRVAGRGRSDPSLRFQLCRPPSTQSPRFCYEAAFADQRDGRRGEK
jgi:hypothetical protein